MTQLIIGAHHQCRHLVRRVISGVRSDHRRYPRHCPEPVDSAHNRIVEIGGVCAGSTRRSISRAVDGHIVRGGVDRIKKRADLFAVRRVYQEATANKRFFHTPWQRGDIPGRSRRQPQLDARLGVAHREPQHKDQADSTKQAK